LAAVGGDARRIVPNASDSKMSRFWKIFGLATLLGAGAVVHAAPPTVTPSPGYDARLQEQRAAAAKVTPPAATPVTPRNHNKAKRN
jgi:hypothetical protein